MFSDVVPEHYPKVHPIIKVGDAVFKILDPLDGQDGREEPKETSLNLERYFTCANGAVVVYDTTVRETFERAKMWIAKIKEVGRADLMLALAGNKCDLVDLRAVGHEEAASWAGGQEVAFFETSALSGHNVTRLFQRFL